MLSEPLKRSIESALAEPIVEARSVSGGDICASYRIQTNLATYFLKHKANHEALFEAEAEGLQRLKSVQGSFLVPNVVAIGAKPAYLLLDWLDMRSAPSDQASYMAGKALASIHLSGSNNAFYGFETDNFIGSLPQENGKYSRWDDFYYEKRGLNLLNKGIERGFFNSDDIKAFDKFFKQYSQDIPPHAPALLHGDLWSGNYAFTKEGEPVFFDPAVYYGHPEMDLAMTQLFGGFSKAFYIGYEEHNPNIALDWRQRLDAHQLWPLLVHAHLFGGSYVQQVRRIIRKVD